MSISLDGGHGTRAPFAHPTNSLRLEIRDLGRGCEQAAAWRPQFAVLVAVTLVEDLGVGDREHAAGVFGGEIVRVSVEIGRQRHRAEWHKRAPDMKDATEERIRH